MYDNKQTREEYIRGCYGEVTAGSDGKEHKYYWNEETEQELMLKIDKLLSLQMNGVDIFLVGSWIWISGDTKQYKKELKAAVVQAIEEKVVAVLMI